MSFTRSDAKAGVSRSEQRWRLTTYYTAVESFHHDAPVQVKGHPGMRGGPKRQVLGSFPRSFVQAVKDEGTGRITSGGNAGKYLNWSFNTGFWLDTAPRDSYGGVLVPYQSCASGDQGSAQGLERGARLTIFFCGRDTDSGDAPDPGACKRMMSAKWVVRDQFTPGLGGENHIDLYIGEEDCPNFENVSPRYVDLSGAQVKQTRQGAA